MVHRYFLFLIPGIFAVYVGFVFDGGAPSWLRCAAAVAAFFAFVMLFMTVYEAFVSSRLEAARYERERRAKVRAEALEEICREL